MSDEFLSLIQLVKGFYLISHRSLGFKKSGLGIFGLDADVLNSMLKTYVLDLFC